MTDLYTNPAVADRHPGDDRPTTEYHYFLSSYDVWIVSGDLSLGLKRFWKASVSDHCAIYRVPVGVEDNYRINFYAPQVEGTTLVEEVFRTQKAADKARK